MKISTFAGGELCAACISAAVNGISLVGIEEFVHALRSTKRHSNPRNIWPGYNLTAVNDYCNWCKETQRSSKLTATESAIFRFTKNCLNMPTFMWHVSKIHLDALEQELMREAFIGSASRRQTEGEKSKTTSL